MTCKKCNSWQDPIIINTSECALSKYFVWKENPNKLCFNCWLEENK